MTDEWVELACIINLNDDPSGDTLQILYGGVGFSSRDWSQGGTTTFEAIDLWGDQSVSVVYYDTFLLETLPPVGACCLPDSSGSCISDADVAACATAD